MEVILNDSSHDESTDESFELETPMLPVDQEGSEDGGEDERLLLVAADHQQLPSRGQQYERSSSTYGEEEGEEQSPRERAMHTQEQQRQRQRYGKESNEEDVARFDDYDDGDSASGHDFDDGDDDGDSDSESQQQNHRRPSPERDRDELYGAMEEQEKPSPIRGDMNSNNNNNRTLSDTLSFIEFVNEQHRRQMMNEQSNNGRQQSTSATTISSIPVSPIQKRLSTSSLIHHTREEEKDRKHIRVGQSRHLPSRKKNPLTESGDAIASTHSYQHQVNNNNNHNRYNASGSNHVQQQKRSSTPQTRKRDRTDQIMSPDTGLSAAATAEIRALKTKLRDAQRELDETKHQNQKLSSDMERQKTYYLKTIYDVTANTTGKRSNRNISFDGITGRQSVENDIDLSEELVNLERLEEELKRPFAPPVEVVKNPVEHHRTPLAKARLETELQETRREKERIENQFAQLLQHTKKLAETREAYWNSYQSPNEPPQSNTTTRTSTHRASSALDKKVQKSQAIREEINNIRQKYNLTDNSQLQQQQARPPSAMSSDYDKCAHFLVESLGLQDKSVLKRENIERFLPIFQRMLSSSLVTKTHSDQQTKDSGVNLREENLELRAENEQLYVSIAKKSKEIKRIATENIALRNRIVELEKDDETSWLKRSGRN